MIKAVFFDIDWTLYDHEAKRFVPTAIEGIKKLKEKGIKVFICSARNTESIFSFGLYNLGIEWDGFISSAGAFAVIGKDHVVRKTLMEHEDLVKLSSLVLKNGLTMQMVTPWSRFLIAPPNEFYKSYQEIFHDDCPTIHSYSNEEVTKTFNITDETSINVYNNGNLQSKPIIKITRTGTIEFKQEGITIFSYTFPTDDTYVVIDAEKEDAYVGTTLKNRSMNGEFPILKIGKNVLSWSGTITKIEVSQYSRWL